ncbi:MAG: group III truncated hemoglobin [Flavobacteriaceae bacterium]
MKNDLTNREDVYLLVTTFYAKVRKDALLGSIFNPMIEDWDEHFEKLTDFWEGNLFFKKKYLGNPLEKHVEVDQFHHGNIEAKHFGVWLNLWFETIDELFEGEAAQRAKNRARNMSTFIHLKIFEARDTASKQSE